MKSTPGRRPCLPRCRPRAARAVALAAFGAGLLVAVLRPDASAASASAAIEVADDADCELGRGWRFSKPLAPCAFAQWVRTGERARADAATAPAPQGTPAPAGNPSGT